MSKQSNFFAFISRMKFINRWGLMRNMVHENLAEHSLQAAMIAHALAIIKNRLFKGSVNPDTVAVMALYHDTSEIFTGDMPTPIKYFNPSIKAAYKEVESEAAGRLLHMLPDELIEDYKPVLKIEAGEYAAIIKAADKICAYLKCVEEEKAGNTDFKKAKVTLGRTIQEMVMPEVDYFMEIFATGFALSLDEME